MRGKNILCAGLGFLVILISAYFGAAIHNSKTNVHITHLNEMDYIDYFDADLIPQLNHKAATFTMPLVLTILFFELFIAFKSKIRQIRNIAIGLSVAVLAILIMGIITMLNPHGYDFSRWGYVWITMGVFIVAGNILSVFVKGNTGKSL